MTLDSEKSAVFILMRDFREEEEEEKVEFSRRAGRGGGINEMQISPPFFFQTVTAEASL